MTAYMRLECYFTKRRPDEKKVDHYTWVRRLPGGGIALKYYRSDIAVAYPGGLLEVDLYGYMDSPKTRGRLRDYLNLGVYSSGDGVYYAYVRGGVFPANNRMTFNTGEVWSPRYHPELSDWDARDLRGLVHHYAVDYARVMTSRAALKYDVEFNERVKTEMGNSSKDGRVRCLLGLLQRYKESPDDRTQFAPHLGIHWAGYRTNTCVEEAIDPNTWRTATSEEKQRRVEMTLLTGKGRSPRPSDGRLRLRKALETSVLDNLGFYTGNIK